MAKNEHCMRMSTAVGLDGENFLACAGRVRRTILLLTVVVMMAGLVFASPALAAPGGLDPTFSGDGKLTTHFGSDPSTVTPYDFANALALQEDGKIVVAGTSSYDNNIDDFALSRYNVDGSPDAGFDGDGKLTTDFGSTMDSANDLAVQPDGKIVVAGTSSDRFALARYNTDGSLDTSFDGDGMSTTEVSPPYQSVLNALALQSNGKIVVAGWTYDGRTHNFALIRYNADGSLDTTFDGDGKLTTDFDTTSNTYEYADDVAIQADEKIVVTGTTSSNGNNEDFAVARYNPDGSLDASFDGDGKLTTSISTTISGWDDANALALQPDGNIVVAGNSLRAVSNASGAVTDYRQDTTLVRYRSDGSLDPSFDGDGKLTTTVGSRSDEHTNALVVQPDGKIVVGGVSMDSGATNNATEVGLVRYSADGSLDNSFDGDGKQMTAITPFNNRANDLVLQPDGKMVVAGWSRNEVDGDPNAGTTDFFVARFDTRAPETVGQTVEAGGTLTSDPEGDGASASDPVETSITSPVAGPVSIEESAAVTQSSAGYSLLGQQVNIEAPASTAENPLRFVFVLDSSLIPAGEDQGTVQVFRNGARVADCADQSGTASPDPCVLGRELLADGDVEFSVLTSHASAWNFGVVEAAPTIRGVTPLNLAKNVSAKANATATFSEAMRGSTINKTTFSLVKKGTTTPITAKVSYSAATNKATLDPGRDLKARATYVAKVKGGTTGARDLAGNALARDKVWTFTIRR